MDTDRDVPVGGFHVIFAIPRDVQSAFGSFEKLVSQSEADCSVRGGYACEVVWHLLLHALPGCCRSSDLWQPGQSVASMYIRRARSVLFDTARVRCEPDAHSLPCKAEATVLYACSPSHQTSGGHSLLCLDHGRLHQPGLMDGEVQLSY